jgi:hypothetical protein
VDGAWLPEVDRCVKLISHVDGWERTTWRILWREESL